MGHISPHLGHIHFWDHGVSRRQFLASTAGAAAALAAPQFWTTALADSDKKSLVSPKPIPGGITVPVTPPVSIHHYPFGQSKTPFDDPSEITDFDGFVTNCRVKGTGTGTDHTTGARTPLQFQVDNGFMAGKYVGVDGKQHHGTFAFI